VVDDSEDNRDLIRLILEGNGAQVELSSSGAQAVEASLPLCRSSDLILMDIQMPGMNGYEATAILRDKGYDRPILALTANAMIGERERCIAAGCNGFLTKPINQKELIETIGVHLFGIPSLKAEEGHVEPLIQAPPVNDKNAEAGVKVTTELPIISTLRKGDPVYEIVPRYVAHLRGDVIKIAQYIKQCDWIGLGNLAHQLSGAGSGYGFDVVTDLARELELAARESQPNLVKITALAEKFSSISRRIALGLEGEKP
jgi:CheY-like chemotaxis protein